MVKKPTGLIGKNTVKVHVDGTASHSFEKVEFPKEKDAVEALIVKDFIASMNNLTSSSGMKWFMSDVTQNPENDFDFTVTLPNGGKAFLELMEIAPLELFGGYDKAPREYRPYDLAQVITAKILKKAVRYSGHMGSELHLLTYITHWGFTPSESLINLVRFFLSQESHPFTGVYLYSPLEVGAGTGRVLAPVESKHFGGFNPENYRENTVINLDPTKWKLISAPFGLISGDE